jgi:lysophospholipase L1-like esterase
MGAAIINVGNGSSDSTGKIWTFPLSGGTAPYTITNANNLTPLTATNTGGGWSTQYPIVSAAISTTNLVLTMGVPLSSDDTATLTVATNATISDALGNTPAGNSGLSVTNNSAVAANRFTWLNTNLLWLGRFRNVTGSLSDWVEWPDNGDGSTLVWAYNGTDCSFQVVGGGNTYSLTVDGNAPVTVTAINNGGHAFVSAGSGLSSGWHTYALAATSASGYIIGPNAIQGFGGTGALRVPGPTDGQGYGPTVQLLSGNASVDSGSWIGQPNSNYWITPGGTISNADNLWNLGSGGSAGAFAGCEVRVSGKGSSLYVFGYGIGSTLNWTIDGYVQTPVTMPNTGVNELVNISGNLTLDQNTNHIYTIFTNNQSAVRYIDGVMLVGSSAAFSSTPIGTLPGLAGLGDSILTAAGLDLSVGFFHELAANAGMMSYNRGIGGCLVGGNSTQACQNRTIDITGISPQPSICLFQGGTNDMTAGGNGSVPSSSFGAAYLNMLNQTMGNTTVSMLGIAMGILQRTGYSSATINAWNGPGNGIQGAVAAWQAANPTQANRLVYVPPPPTFNPATDTQDGLHPNTAGTALIVANLQSYITLPFAGAGANATTLTVTSDGTTPVVNASAWVTSDAQGLNAITGQLVTNSSGNVTFQLTSGNQYYLSAVYNNNGTITKILDAVAFTA